MTGLESSEAMLSEGRIDEAIAALKDFIASSEVPSDRAYYLLGNAYRKKGDWQGAINNYLEAMEINPDSPAKNAYSIANEILDFYNKDMYNQ
ncbi:MAG: tetratricopeptide repeat protein [Bacteroidales bacterium]|nr:tetratricopeptide repeat protein [Bacteroidales bacterium]